MNNFAFLKEKWPVLANLGEMAERNLHQDPNTSLIKIRIFGEMMVKFIFALEKLPEPDDNSQVNRLNILGKEDSLTRDLLELFHDIRKTGNRATHEAYGNVKDAGANLEYVFRLGVWFMQTYGDWDFEPREFVLPKSEDALTSENLKVKLDELSQDYETKMTKLEEELEGFRQQQISQEYLAKRREQSQRASAKLMLSEAETRKIIDEKLRAAGWEVDSELLSWSKGIRPEKNKNKAIAEWPTEHGHADYALFAGLILVGVVEAKKMGKEVVSDLGQAKKYAKYIKLEEDQSTAGGPWGEYRVPFLFSTNGREYLKQIQQKSGIWFLDGRKNTNHPRPLHAWYSPQGLLDLLKQDIQAAQNRLKAEPFDYLIDNLQLRDYQVNAIQAIEEGIAEGNHEILIAMATGTGKTRTAIALIYRLIKSQRFKRILFLVDRNALGEQAGNAFIENKIDGLMTFNEIYDIKSLEDKKPEIDTKVHIATVQGMVKRILYSQEEAERPTVDQYDCILVDEAHRGYILDREMGEAEIQFRDQNDYISKYCRVLEYFDAVKVGMTATPAPQTVQLFGKPVFTYSYREAVIDNWLVDHEPPFEIGTQLQKGGIHWQRGETVPVYDSLTGQITNLENIADELDFEIEHFNRQVITENFNRAVLSELVKHLDPTGEEKTLIFAASDDHADMVAEILKEEFEKSGVEIDDDAIMKITGSIHNPMEAIRRFKNERLPNIAVTVDLLTTGIDVPDICNLVFLRRVKSRILYEQMLGRATRLCPDIKKTHFNIFDAVGLYEALEKVTNMKPVVVNPQIKFADLIHELGELKNEEQKRHIETIIAKLQRKRKSFDRDDEEFFGALSGGVSPQDFIEWLKTAATDKITDSLKSKTDLIAFLDENIYRPHTQFISHHADKITEISRGYGKGEKPDDYLKEFKQFLEENINKLPALQIVCQRPKELTRQALKELLIELGTHGFTELNLNTAWRDLKNEDMVADIISFIRQQMLGDALISHEERVKKAMQKVKNAGYWTKVQLGWLDKIELQLLAERIVDRDSFDKQPFKKDGGYDRANKIFGGDLDNVLQLINDNLYPERSTA